MAFGIDDAVAAGLKILDKFIPDPAEKAKAALEMRQLLQQVALAQIDLNKAEVASARWLGQWRGALGWGLVASLVYQFILYPFLIATILILDPAFPVERLPVLDWKELGSLLIGMLGLS
jgi:hypothetical protein